jgi:NAD(P)-dependent dehydrogenase (short-subunit alcohol dehydrogenase family)
LQVTEAAGGRLRGQVVIATQPEQTIARSRESRCLRRDEVPEDLEGTLVHLLSRDSDFVTGQMLVVNGGAQFW